jgi:polyphosphate kinase
MANVFNFITGYAEPEAGMKLAGLADHAAQRILDHIERGDRACQGRRAGGDLDEDELAGRSRDHRRAL